MATHSSVLAWRIPGTGEPGGLPSVPAGWGGGCCEEAGRPPQAGAGALGPETGYSPGGDAILFLSAQALPPGTYRNICPASPSFTQ